MTAELESVLTMAEAGIEHREAADLDVAAERKALATVRERAGMLNSPSRVASPVNYPPDDHIVRKVRELGGQETEVGLFESNSVAYHHRVFWNRLGFESRTARIIGHGHAVYARVKP